MNYYRAREITDPATGQGTGLFHYTCARDLEVWSVGNCSPLESCPDCKDRDPPFGLIDCGRCGGKRLVRKANPCSGHATVEEACEHQKEYELDHARFDAVLDNEQRKCVVCQAWTQRMAQVGHGLMHSYALCDLHCNRESLARLYSVGESVSSC